MRKFIKNLFKKGNSKYFWMDICFVTLLLFYWKVADSRVKTIIAALEGNMVKLINAESYNRCEQSVYAMVRCHEFGVYIIGFFTVLAALLYHKYKKTAFSCLIIGSVLCWYVAKILI